MRLIAIILALTVLCLAFKPGFDAIVSCENSEVSCCTESCDPYAIDTSGESENNGNCTGNSCNPFLSCGLNFVLSLDAFETDHQNPELSSERNFNYQFNIHSQFSEDFWQPPQFA